MAAFGDAQHPRGFQQFSVAAFHRGPDGRAHTADDLELGPVDVNWSIEIFYEDAAASADTVGTITSDGFFAPAATSPGANFDVWAVAVAKNEKDRNGRALVGKSYMVVTVPTYTFNGRRYVRDLDRWVDDGPTEARPRQ